MSPSTSFFQQAEGLSPGESIHIDAPAQALAVTWYLHLLDHKGPHVVIFSDESRFWEIEKSLFFFEPLQKTFFLKTLSPFELLSKDPAHTSSARMEWLVKARTATPADIFFATPQSLTQKLMNASLFSSLRLTLTKGQKLPSQLTLFLNEMGYLDQDMVKSPGEYCYRHSVLDIYCPSTGPLRIELIGDEIMQIKNLNTKTQTSHSDLPFVSIWPAVYLTKISSRLASIFKISPPANKSLFSTKALEYFPTSPLCWYLQDLESLKHTISLWKKNLLKDYPKQNWSALYFNDWKPTVSKKTREIVFCNQVYNNPSNNFKSPAVKAIPNDFFKNHSQSWIKKIKAAREQNQFVFLSLENKEHAEYVKHKVQTEDGLQVEEEDLWKNMLFSQSQSPKNLHIINRSIPDSLHLIDERILFLKPPLFLFKKKKEVSPPALETEDPSFVTKSLSFSDLNSGDYVIHKQHGLAKYLNLESLDMGVGKTEFLVLEYKDKAKLYVPVYSLHQIQKYFGSLLSSDLALDTLGGSRWNKVKGRAEKKITDLALDLIHLYSTRSKITRPLLPSTGEDYHKFSKEFPFPETLDQANAIKDVLKDLCHRPYPADRLISGDVGYGKTEVVMRAAFKTMEEGFQVCVMAPTTLLTFQHFERFKDRFKSWPFTVQLLNRFTSPLAYKKIVKEVREGKVDILIGTIRVLSRDIHFKNLRLLVIDEEHLFGVKSKEKLKSWKSDMDILSLSATPIPRSLNMHLSGLKDISVINTPPKNRKPVETYIYNFTPELIKQAILKELDRAGQVIFIHNRIADIDLIEKKLKSLVPAASIRVAHGRMKDLQKKIVLDFFYKKFNLLLCTTIVESGMDFSNANTLFINRADKFGLSELHQIRGRTGRSQRQAFCHLLLDPHKKPTPASLERLRIIKENNQHGAGLLIAKYDLEMRGAGELIGSEQSGFLKDIGVEMYFELMEEKIQSLNSDSKIAKKAPEPDINLKIPAYLPKKFIPHDKARLLIYKKLSFAINEKEMDSLKEELSSSITPQDLPDEVKNLFHLGHLRILAKKWHIRELSVKSPFLYLNFADSTPLAPKDALNLTKEHPFQWHNKSTLKIKLKDSRMGSILKILKSIKTSSG